MMKQSRKHDRDALERCISKRVAAERTKKLEVVVIHISVVKSFVVFSHSLQIRTFRNKRFITNYIFPTLQIFG